jgi:hypothetical protein
METEILSTLNEIKTLLENSSPTWIPALLTMTGTLLGGIVAGFWQYKNSQLNMKQLSDTKRFEVHSEVVSKQRQQWMDQLRRTAAEFLAEYDVIVSDFTKNEKSKKEHAKLYQSTNEKGNLMFLMLNPDKPDQKTAMQALANMQTIVGIQEKEGGLAAQEKYDEYRDALGQALLKVFNKTWKKIKNFD